jgi:hypothetical protein
MVDSREYIKVYQIGSSGYKGASERRRMAIQEELNSARKNIRKQAQEIIRLSHEQEADKLITAMMFHKGVRKYSDN